MESTFGTRDGPGRVPSLARSFSTSASIVCLCAPVALSASAVSFAICSAFAGPPGRLMRIQPGAPLSPGLGAAVTPAAASDVQGIAISAIQPAEWRLTALCSPAMFHSMAVLPPARGCGISRSTTTLWGLTSSSA